MAKPLLWVAAFAVAALAFFPSYVTTAKVDYNTGEVQLQFTQRRPLRKKLWLRSARRIRVFASSNRSLVQSS